MAIANLLVNVVMVGLLAATIGYCWMLNRRIQILQDSKSELAQLLKHFDESTQRASESIIALQTASKKIGENIQLRIDKANYLVDDLAFMIEKGNKLADQLEASQAVNRARSRAMSEPEPQEEAMENAETKREKTRASLEAMLERVMGRSKLQQPEPVEKKETPPPPARSRSEQELLSLLKAGLKG